MERIEDITGAVMIALHVLLITMMLMMISGCGSSKKITEVKETTNIRTDEQTDKTTSTTEDTRIMTTDTTRTDEDVTITEETYTPVTDKKTGEIRNLLTKKTVTNKHKTVKKGVDNVTEKNVKTEATEQKKKKTSIAQKKNEKTKLTKQSMSTRWKWTLSIITIILIILAAGWMAVKSKTFRVRIMNFFKDLKV